MIQERKAERKKLALPVRSFVRLFIRFIETSWSPRNSEERESVQGVIVEMIVEVRDNYTRLFARTPVKTIVVHERLDSSLSAGKKDRVKGFTCDVVAAALRLRARGAAGTERGRGQEFNLKKRELRRR